MAATVDTMKPEDVQAALITAAIGKSDDILKVIVDAMKPEDIQAALTSASCQLEWRAER